MRREHRVVVLEHRQHQDARLRAGADDAAGRLDAVDARHAAGPSGRRPAAGSAAQRDRLVAGRRPRPRPRRRARLRAAPRSPSRNSGWSSAISTRIALLTSPPPSRSGSRRRDRACRRPAAARPARAAELGRPLAHRDQPDARRRALGGSAAAVVGDLQVSSPSPSSARPNRQARGAGVAHDVGQRLLDDPVGGDLDRGGQRRQRRRRARPSICRPCRRLEPSRAAARAAPPTRPSSSSAGGRSPWTSRRTSAIAACGCPVAARASSARRPRVACRAGRARRPAAASAPASVGPEPVVQVAAQPAALLLARRHQPLARRAAGRPSAARRAAATPTWRARSCEQPLVGRRERFAPARAARARSSPTGSPLVEQRQAPRTGVARRRGCPRPAPPPRPGAARSPRRAASAPRRPSATIAGARASGAGRASSRWPRRARRRTARRAAPYMQPVDAALKPVAQRLRRHRDEAGREQRDDRVAVAPDERTEEPTTST